MCVVATGKLWSNRLLKPEAPDQPMGHEALRAYRSLYAAPSRRLSTSKSLNIFTAEDLICSFEPPRRTNASCNFLVAGRYTTGLSCFDTDKERFLSFPHAEAFSKRATERGGMWYDLRMTGHSAVLCSRGLLIVGGLLPPGHPTMAAWVLDVVGDRLRTRGRRRSVSGTNGKCGMS